MQLDRITGAGTDTHFVFELDPAIHTFSKLSSYYGIPEKAIQQNNPKANPNKLQLKQKVNVPAIDPPSHVFPTEKTIEGKIVNATPVSIRIRWNKSSLSNMIGRVKRGVDVKMINEGVIVRLTDLDISCKGVIEEMKLRGLVNTTEFFGFIDKANVISKEISSQEVELLAKMIFLEQRGVGHDAMVAAAWVARNRFEDGWGSYNDILNKVQFQGLGQSFDSKKLNDIDKRSWEDAMKIAMEVMIAGSSDRKTEALYFGNGKRIKDMMDKCQLSQPSTFSYTTIEGSNMNDSLHISRGNYLDCTIPSN